MIVGRIGPSDADKAARGSPRSVTSSPRWRNSLRSMARSHWSRARRAGRVETRFCDWTAAEVGSMTHTPAFHRGRALQTSRTSAMFVVGRVGHPQTLGLQHSESERAVSHNHHLVGAGELGRATLAANRRQFDCHSNRPIAHKGITGYCDRAWCKL